MSQLGILSTFDHNTNTWKTYKSRITQWFIANDLDVPEKAAKRRAVLLSALADKTYKLAADLALPKDLEETPYEDIIKILDKHFSPKRTGFSDRHKFYSAVQKEGESYAQWALRLRDLSGNCDFSDVDEALRDRFVMGSAPGPARDKLFEQDMEKLSLADGVELADSVRCAHNASKESDSESKRKGAAESKEKETGFLMDRSNYKGF